METVDFLALRQALEEHAPETGEYYDFLPQRRGILVALEAASDFFRVHQEVELLAWDVQEEDAGLGMTLAAQVHGQWHAVPTVPGLQVLEDDLTQALLQGAPVLAGRWCMAQFPDDEGGEFQHVLSRASVPWVLEKMLGPQVWAARRAPVAPARPAPSPGP